MLFHIAFHQPTISKCNIGDRDDVIKNHKNLIHLIGSKRDPLELVIVHALLVRWVRRVIDMAPRLRTSNVIGILSSDTDYLSAQPILF